MSDRELLILVAKVVEKLAEDCERPQAAKRIHEAVIELTVPTPVELEQR